MGLDMYLYREAYVQNWNHNPKKYKVSVKFNENKHPFINPDKVCYIREEVGYWRKANAIHNWIVQHCADGVDECQDIHVEEQLLIELRDTCQKVLDDNSLADELLPTSSGFFFGSTQYDEWYFNGLKHTIDIINGALVEGELPQGVYTPSYIYKASW